MVNALLTTDEPLLHRQEKAKLMASMVVQPSSERRIPVQVAVVGATMSERKSKD